MASHLDETDHRILDELTRDGRMSMRTLAETLHISRANAYARVERLRTTGVIRGFRAEVDPELSGLGTSAYITLNVRQAAWRQIAEQLRHCRASSTSRWSAASSTWSCWSVPATTPTCVGSSSTRSRTWTASSAPARC